MIKAFLGIQSCTKIIVNYFFTFKVILVTYNESWFLLRGSLICCIQVYIQLIWLIVIHHLKVLTLFETESFQVRIGQYTNCLLHNVVFAMSYMYSPVVFIFIHELGGHLRKIGYLIYFLTYQAPTPLCAPHPLACTAV